MLCSPQQFPYCLYRIPTQTTILEGKNAMFSSAQFPYLLLYRKSGQTLFVATASPHPPTISNTYGEGQE